VTDSEGEPIQASWTSSQQISTVVVKSGTDECQFPGGTGGTVTSCGPPPGQQSRGPPTGVAFLGVGGAAVALVGRRENRRRVEKRDG
jgi:hypothetical protein